MYCANCGNQIDDKAVVCVHCGTQVKSLKQNALDRPNFGFALLGFFVPLAGLILYLVYQDTAPMRAKSAGKGALWGVIVSVILTDPCGGFIYFRTLLSFFSPL